MHSLHLIRPVNPTVAANLIKAFSCIDDTDAVTFGVVVFPYDFIFTLS